MTPRRLTSTRRGALSMLAIAGRCDATLALRPWLSAVMIARLVNRGLATATQEEARAGHERRDLRRDILALAPYGRFQFSNIPAKREIESSRACAAKCRRASARVGPSN
jgi:hypothetical protein